jgi:hypothetical protein
MWGISIPHMHMCSSRIRFNSPTCTLVEFRMYRSRIRNSCNPLTHSQGTTDLDEFDRVHGLRSSKVQTSHDEGQVLSDHASSLAETWDRVINVAENKTAGKKYTT